MSKIDWDNVFCRTCGLVNEYTIKQVNNQRVCTCKGCGNFIGNKPKDNYDIANIRIMFGKYKGQRVVDINDLSYLRWLLSNVDTIRGGLLEAIKWKLQ